MSKNKNYFNRGDSIFLNDVEDDQFMRLFNTYKTLALNRYRWENLPKGLESRHIEKALFEYGQAFFYEDKTTGIRCLPCFESNELNIYGDPIGVKVVGYNGFSEHKTMQEGVCVLDNDTRVPPILHIRHFVELMNKTQSTLYANLDQQKFPFIIPMSEETKLTMSNIMEQTKGFQSCIMVDESISEQLQRGNGECAIRVLQTGVPYLLDRLSDFESRVENKLFTFLGLNNTNENKKERMVVDEVNANNTAVQMMLDTGYKCRQTACELVNEMFGLNMSVIKVVDTFDFDLKGDIKNGGSADND